MNRLFRFLFASILLLISSTLWARGGYHGGGGHSSFSRSSYRSSYSKSSYKSSYRPSASRSTSSAVYVRGYRKKNGTYVKGHMRSRPDHSKLNNWSTRGNINPYTGKVGTHSP
jgi:hypothetical protein